LVAVVGPAGRFDVLHLVAGVAPGVVLGGAGQVLGEAGQRRLRGIAVAGGGAVTQGDGGAPRQVIVGIAGQADGAVLQQRGRPVEGVIAGRDVERGGFRPGGAGARPRLAKTCGAIQLRLLTPYRLRLTAFRWRSGFSGWEEIGRRRWGSAARDRLDDHSTDAPPGVGTSYRVQSPV
jgi:hypothetical protein